MAIDFHSALSFTDDDCDRPKSAPEGWLVATLGQYELQETKGAEPKGIIVFPLLDIEPHPETDVTSNAWKGVNFEKLRSPYRKMLTAEFWLTPAARYHLADACTRLVGRPNVSVEERVNDLKGLRVMFRVAPVMEDGKDTGQNTVDSRTLTPFNN